MNSYDDYIARAKGVSLDGAMLLDAVFSALLDDKRDFAKMTVSDLVKLAEIGFRAWQLAPQKESDNNVPKL